MKLDILLCGVGGQGVLLASEIIAEVALRRGFDVKKSEIHGMAQRGGSVFSHLRIADKVYSPIIPKGSADFIIAFEKLEAARYLDYASEECKVIVNNQRINPITVVAQKAVYPDDVVEFIKKHFEVYEIDALGIAKELGNVRTVNMVITGFFSNFVEIDENIWMDVIKDRVPDRFLDVNVKAFMIGRSILGGSDV